MKKNVTVFTGALLVALVGTILFTNTPGFTVAAQMGGMQMPQPTAAEKKTLGDLHKQLESFKGNLTKAGKLNCCLKESCDFCPLAAAMCPCEDKVAKGEGVCGECKMGWQAGQGKVPNVNPASVKSLDDMMSKMMMDARAMQISAAKGGKSR